MRMVRWTPNDEIVNRTTRMAALDVLDYEDHVEVRMDLPGVASEDVNIEVKDDVLTISANVKSDETRETNKYTYRERYTGSYKRSLRVPETVNVQNAEAKFENGVLSLKMPKVPEPAPIRIPVHGVAVHN